jgi:hypothetical protein
MLPQRVERCGKALEKLSPVFVVRRHYRALEDATAMAG